MHPSPRVRPVAYAVLGTNRAWCSPIRSTTREMVAAVRDCTFVLTDSGGIQEEAPCLGKPVLVMRDETERPEGVDAGTLELVGHDRERIVEARDRLLTDRGAFDAWPAPPIRTATAGPPSGSLPGCWPACAEQPTPSRSLPT